MTDCCKKLYSTAWIWTCSFLITEKGNLRSTKKGFITVSSKGSETQIPRTRRALAVKQRPTVLGVGAVEGGAGQGHCSPVSSALGLWGHLVQS